MSIRKLFLSMPLEATGMMMHIFLTGMAFLIGIILARYLGPEMFGEYAYMLAWVSLASSFLIAGFSRLLVRDIAAYKHNQQYGLIQGIVSVAAIVVTLVFALLAVAVLLANLSGQMQKWDVEIILAGLLSLLFLSWTVLCQSATRGLGHVLVGQLSNKIIKPAVQLLLLTFLVLGLYSESLTAKTALYAFTIAAFFGLLFAVFILQKKRRKHDSLRKEYDFRRWYSSFWRMSLLGWMGALNLQLSVILLGLLGGETDVARYKVAAQIALLMPFGLKVMNSIQMPILSNAYSSGDKVELQRLAGRSCTISFFTAFPILLIAIFFGEELILKVFGSGYQNAGMILLLLSLGQLVNVSAGSSGLLMLVSRNEQTVMITQAAVLLMNSVLCIILIPRMGAMGAAIAATASLSLRNIYLVFSIYRSMGIVSLPGLYKRK